MQSYLETLSEAQLILFLPAFEMQAFREVN